MKGGSLKEWGVKLEESWEGEVIDCLGMSVPPKEKIYKVKGGGMKWKGEKR